MSKVTPLATTQPARELTLADLFDAFGSVLVRLEDLTKAVNALTAEVAALKADRK